MIDSPSINWQLLYQRRREIAHRFGKIWNLPIDRRYYTVLARHGKAGIHLLEVGAGDRGLEKKMQRYWGDFVYRSCDIDTTYQHDFNSIDQVTGEYDIACAFELVEHLSLTETVHFLKCTYQVLKPGGTLLLTTPNIYYPPGFLRDATHVTPFCYDELGGVVQLAGFHVIALYRLHHDSISKKFLKRFVFYPLYRVLGIDFAKQIMLVAEKPPE